MTEPEETDSEMVQNQEGVSLNHDGVTSPAKVHIRSVQEGGKSNSRRLQFKTISTSKSKIKENEEIIG
jgi:hypothetical protein